PATAIPVAPPPLAATLWSHPAWWRSADRGWHRARPPQPARWLPAHGGPPPAGQRRVPAAPRPARRRAAVPVSGPRAGREGVVCRSSAASSWLLLGRVVVVAAGALASQRRPLSPAGREGKSSPLRAQFLPDPRRGLAIGRAKATAQVGAGADVLDGLAQAIAHPRQVGGGRLLDVVHREG